MMGRGVPIAEAKLACGMPSTSAATHPPNSIASHTSRSGPTRAACASRSSTIPRPATAANAPIGGPTERWNSGSDAGSDCDQSTPLGRTSNPALVNAAPNVFAVATHTSCPASRAAASSGSIALRCARPGTQVKRSRMVPPR
jgi:hypothetical protein